MFLDALPSAIVAMPVYNDTEYLPAALDSILQQSFTNFQLLVIDDGSDDATKDILKHYAKRGVKCLHFKKNKGRPFARNKALAYALDSHKEHGTDYLFWMDADDLSRPNRLEKQISFMQERKDISILSTAMYCMGTNVHGHNVDTTIKKSNGHEAIWAQSVWTVPMFQAPACYRLAHLYEQGTDILYDTKMLRVEDYAFWLKLLFQTSLKFANISEALYVHRHEFRPTNNMYHVMAVKKLLQYLELPNSTHNCLMHTILSCSSFDGLKLDKPISLHEIIHWGNTVYEQVENFGKISMTHFLRITHFKMEQIFALEKNPHERKELLKYYAGLPLGTTHDLRPFFPA